MDTKQTEEATQERSECQHHWLVDPPAGPVSTGACRSCGEERDFPNYIEGRFNNARNNILVEQLGSSPLSTRQGQI